MATAPDLHDAITPQHSAIAPANADAGTTSGTIAAVLEPFDGVDQASQHTAEAENQYPTGAKFYSILLSIAVLLVLGGLDASIVATAVPAITDHFHTVADVGWYSVAFRLPLCAFQFFFGKLYKLFSIKRIMLVSQGIFLLGSLLCATAVSSKMFVLGRALTGFAAASIVAGAFTLLTLTLPLRLRPVYTGMFGAIECVAVIAAPVLGGILTQKLSWRWCFWINLPLGVPPIIIMAIFFSDPRESPAKDMTWSAIFKQLDLLGTVAFVPAITCLFLALSWAGAKYAFDSPIVLCLYAAFALLLALFVWDQHRKQDAATLPPRIFKQRSIVAGFIFSFCCSASNNVVEYYMPSYFQVVRGYSPAKSGYMMIPILIGFLVGMLVHGSGVSLTGYYTPFMLFGSILMPLATGLITTWNPASSLAELIAYSLLAGFSYAIGYQGPQSAVQTVLSDADGPLGLSVVLFAQHFGPALSVSMAQTIFTNRLTVNLREEVPGLHPKAIENLGLGEIVSHIGRDKMKQVLLGIDRSIVEVWYLPLGLTCASMIGSLMMEWRSVKEKKN
ncbi:hypothetical protein LTR85_000557 [Meristemomyces frigidus]|nr:hypothetical protein LTR85_000557 [Meristemomyces frigidus]